MSVSRLRIGSQFQWSPVFAAAVLLLFVAACFGGASREHELRVALVELAALPLLLLAVLEILRRHSVSRLALGCIAVVVAIPAIQLIPLPPAVWTGLPGRQALSLALQVTELAPSWTPISLSPDRTWRSLLALVAPIAMFLGAVSVTGDQRRSLFYGILAFAVISVGLGAVQLASGGNQFYPWRTTDWPSVVGLFANRNHMATLCLVAIPVATALGARQLRKRRTTASMGLWLSGICIALMVVGLGAIRSRTGVALLIPTLVISLLAGWIAAGRGRPKTIVVGIAAAAAIGLSAVAFFALGPILARFDTGGSREGRFENWPIILDASSSFLPFGSGIGSFDAVFRSVEPWERLQPTFFNQAHNEYLEIWLETGWFGIAGLILFLVWFLRRSAAAWAGQVSSDRDLQRGASVAIGIMLLHSIVDYPLRTLTLAVVFALCCATLELAGRSDEGRRRDSV